MPPEHPLQAYYEQLRDMQIVHDNAAALRGSWLSDLRSEWLSAGYVMIPVQDSPCGKRAAREVIWALAMEFSADGEL